MDEIAEILSDAKSLAKRYKKLTGKPLGITSEIAEFSAADILGLELAEARQEGYDAIRKDKGKEIRVQIKGRCIPNGAKLARDWGRFALIQSGIPYYL